MNHSTRLNRFALLLPLSVVSLAVNAHALGGAEVYCEAGELITERWLDPANVEWIILGEGGAHPANEVRDLLPNYPAPECTDGLLMTSGPPTNEYPGLQSLTRAFQAWTGRAELDLPMPAWQWTSNPVGGAGWGQPPFIITGLDNGLNTITFWEPEEFWDDFGGSVVLAATLIRRDDATGAITDADIAFNALSINENTNQSCWSFLEQNDVHDKLLATHEVGFGISEPFLGYVDLQGAAVHEFGHFIGLGHSLVDSVMNSDLSLTPTMFGTSEVRVSCDAYDTCISGSNNFVIETAPFVCLSEIRLVNAGNTQMTGFLATAARTLEADDVNAAWQAYPADPDDLETLGLGELEVTVSGAGGIEQGHVVALKADAPDIVRVGSLPIGNVGNERTYTFGVLPYGDYYVHFEPVALAVGEYFEPGAFPPEVVEDSPCVDFQANVVPEFYDAAEDEIEISPELADLVTIDATPESIDIEPQNGTATLRIGLDNAAQLLSARGLRIDQLAGQNQSVRLAVRAQQTEEWSGFGAFLAAAVRRENAHISNDQLLQIPLTGPGAIGVSPPVILDIDGEAQFNITVQPSLAYNNIFFQVVFIDPGNGEPHVSNVVNLAIFRP